MRVIESLCVGKIDEASCEDALVVTDDFIAVCDGVTAKAPGGVAGMTRGRYAAQLVVEVLRTLPAAASVVEFLAAAQQRLVRAYAEDGSAGLPEVVRRFQTCVGVLSRARREVWLVGDIQVLVDGARVVDTTIALEAITSAARGLYLEAALLQGAEEADLRSHDPAQDLIRPFVGCGMTFSNTEHRWGFSVIDGAEVPLSLVPVVDVSAASEVVLATDGYPNLRPTLVESEAVLARVLAADPLCIRENPQPKGLAAGQVSYDDRAYVRVALASDR